VKGLARADQLGIARCALWGETASVLASRVLVEVRSNNTQNAGDVFIGPEDGRAEMLFGKTARAKSDEPDRSWSRERNL
jgi:hypothetical protein